MDIVDRLAALGLRFAAGRFAVFPDGLGNGDLTRLVERIPAPSATISPIDLDWTPREPTNGIARSIANFESPFGYELPEGPREVFVEKIEPSDGAKRTIVLLQMWGDEGLSLRRKLAERLAPYGIATVLPVHPFYGRRRVHENGPPIRTVDGPRVVRGW